MCRGGVSMADRIAAAGMSGNAVDDPEGTLCGELASPGGHLTNSEAPPACPNPSHVGSRVRRRGLRTSAAGTRQRLECVPDDGGKHFFTLPVPQPVEPPAPTRVRCPDPRHADARIHARGTRKSKAGTWQRYRCIRPDGTRHDFQVLAAAAAGSQLTSLDRPPPCPEHKRSRVTRHGVYGKGHRKRQRYRCIPLDDPSAAHTFTPPLTREVVAVGADSCATCDELLSPHRGTLTGARHTPWTLTLYARALNDLSMGASYASVSLMMRKHRDRASRHLLEHQGEAVLLNGQAAGSPESYTAKQGKSAWHLAANLVEQYAPLLWRGVEQQMRERDQRQRAANDEKLGLSPDAALATPVTWLLDEQPVILSRRRGRERRLERLQWSLLVAVEVRWHPAPDPMSFPGREYRLRLARAYPRANEQAWRLVLDELGVRPDFIVADNAGAISNAVSSHYGPDAVGLVPSLFHIQRNIRAVLKKLPGATTKVEGRTVLAEPVARHLDMLDRDDLLNLNPADWSTWWDDLVDTVAALPAPVTSLLEQRRLYEPRVAKALPILTKHPHLPASNAAVENRIRHALEPFLDNRKQLYRNLARTNFLLDLAVARAQGAFTDLDEVARLLREDNEAAGGWAPAPRTLADAQPPPRAASEPAPVYSSLLNPLLVAALAEQRLRRRS